jgi:amino acid adenylation domain-containing protein/FkbH-like protein
MSNTAKNLDGIAIVGMAGRFPKARNIEEFWRNLCEGRESVSFFSVEELETAGISIPTRSSNYVKARAILEDADMFDAAFFGMNPKEAELTDPQHRVFLECAWEALENAGCDPHKYPGAIGVFAGMSTNTYLTHNLTTSPQLLIGINGEFNAMVGNDRDFLPTRVSYKLNLKGPSLNIQTACSTSLVAVCVACQHLLTYQCDMALAGAVSISFPQKRGYVYQEGAITSPDGHCRPFDAESAGTIAGEGVGVVALKRLEDAIADGDSIYAVIKGFGMNNDGGAKIGYTAPSVEGQAEVIAMAQAMAGFDPRTITYVEAHGTATPLGDPIEIEGLTKAFRLGTNENNFCAIGSVKGNIGHLDTAAGIVGLIKTALALHHKKIPPSLHFKSANPKINFAESPFFVNTELRDWKSEGPRRAGISSFGIGGTNAHMVLEEAPEIESSRETRPAQLLLLSAKTTSALDQATSNLVAHFEKTSVQLSDAAFTLQTGRHHFAQRRMLVCRSAEDAGSALKSRDSKRVLSNKVMAENPPIVFMFPGQGAQRVNMGRELYKLEPVFREEVDRCAEILREYLNFDLRDVLFPGDGANDSKERITQTAITQPAMFVIEYALAKLWMSWGVRPQLMIGHSLGEYAAACLAGVFSLPDALKLIAERGQMIQQLPSGTMLAVRLPEHELRPLLTNDLSLAAVNAPSLCVVSGANEAVERFKQSLSEKNIAFIPLQTSHAFHSAMMEPILTKFTELVRSIPRHAPQIPFISNFTGKQITADEATDPSYWANHLRRTVRFADGLSEALKVSNCVLLEVGPGQTLIGLAKQIIGRDRGAPIIASLSRPGEATELDDVLSALGQLWLNGVSPDWKNFYAREKRSRIWFPTYPFERKRYWVEPPRERKLFETTLSPELAETSGGGEDTALPVASGNGGNGSQAIGSAVILEKTRLDEIETETIQRLRVLIAKMSGFSEDSIETGTTFTQMGFDSLFLTQVSVAVEKEFGVRIGFRQLLEQFSTLDLLAGHIESRVPTERGVQASAVIEPDRISVTPAARNGNGSDTFIAAPLTESQRELWFASQMSHGASCVYNECRLLHLRGTLKDDALRTALQKLVDRHEALRTTFSLNGEAQIIHPTLKLNTLFADWSSLSSGQQNVRLHAIQLEEARNAFDLSNGPLIRARLIRMKDTHHVLIVTVHHIVCDGHSFGILLGELSELYSAEISGEEPQLAPPLQISDYARIQARSDYVAMHDADESFWLKQFATEAPALEVPTDQPRPSVLKLDGARVWRTLPSKISDELRRLAAQQGCTMFTTLLAAYVLLLRKLSRQNELIVGLPMADRMMAGGESLIGHCVNFLPLRGIICDEHTFAEHLAHIQKLFLDAHDHRRYAFGTLIQKLNLSRDPSRMPLVSATFNLERRMEKLNFTGLEAELIGNAHSSTSFDLNFDVSDGTDGFQLDCRYSSEIFSEDTIQRWLGHFETLLREIMANPQQRISELQLLNEDERAAIVGDWSITRSNYPREKCIHELFETQAAQTPDAIALEFGETQLSYRELNERAERIANQLHSLGVKPGSVVAICIERSVEMIVALLGILKAGGAYASLDPAHPRERLEFMLKDMGASLLITQRSLRERFNLEAPDPNIACMEDLASNLRNTEHGTRKQISSSESPAYISFTSGSTGKPKGVCVPHRGVVRLVKNTNYCSFASDEVFLQYAPLAFDASTFEIWGALLNGARLVIAPPHAMSLSELGRFIRERCITTLWLTAGLFHQMVEEQMENLRGVRQLLAGGDVLSVPHVKKALEQLPDCKLINGYGPTENTTFTCCHQITRSSVERRSIPIGRPIANTEVYVLDEYLQPVPIGVPGELHCGGDGLALGYLNRADLNAEKFIPNPFSKNPNAKLYKTGDLVRRLPDGEIEFLGRLDTQVKIRGFRVELDEIEAALNKHKAIRNCAVIAQETSSGKRLVAYFAATEALNAEALRNHLRETLPDYMIPGAFVQLESLPLRTSGKVNRKALLSMEAQVVKPARTFIATSCNIEKRLAEIWEEVLDQRPIGANDDFFELGGHSMLALRLVARIEKVFGKKIPIASVFHARTVAQMANLLREKVEPPRTTSIVGIQEKGTRPPLMFVHGAGGGMFWGYTKLSRYLGNDQPVYAFKSRGMDDLEEFNTIEEMAAHYVSDLKRFQPRGPYYLGGYCFGGNIAYEMARQLRANGDEVAMLALINCVPPNSTYDHVRVTPRFCVKFLKNLVYWAKYFLNLKPEPQREFLRWKISAVKKKFLRQLGSHSGLARFNFDIAEIVDLSAQPESRRSLWETHVHALFRHKPQPYEGDVVLFRTRGHSLLCSFDETFGWRDLVRGELTVRVVPGAHETILDEPHVRLLAGEFEEMLESRIKGRAQHSPQPAVRSSEQPSPDGRDARNGSVNDEFVHQMFESQAKKTPDAVAAVFNGDALTYHDLNQRADVIAAKIRSLGAGIDVPIGICMERSLDMIVGVLGILKSGGAYVPLDPAYPRERLKLMIENSRMPLLLTQRSLREHLNFKGENLKVICVGEKCDVNPTRADNRQSAIPNRQSPLAYVIHTSGSTGVPKGVAMPHAPLVNLIKWQLANSALGAGSRTLQFASLSFDVSFQEMFSTWCSGGTLVLIDEKLRRDPVALLRLIAKEKVERLFLPFIALQQLAEAFGEHIPAPVSLREVITAGEQLQITPKIVRLFAALKGCVLENQYGPSETHVVTGFRLSGPPGEWPALPPIGKPIWNTQVHLLDEKRQPVSDGEIGEIYIGGICLACGYLHRQDLTEQRFVSNPFSAGETLYKTGDLARLLPDGNIEFLGRADDQVKIRGFRIELGEIEAALRRNAKLREAVIVAREDQPRNKRLVAYFIPQPDQSVTSDDLREFLKEKLPDYMVPSLFLQIEALPLTPSGKVDRKQLPAPESLEQGKQNVAAPGNEIEEKLVAIWREVLALKNIGTRDNFFELGGHSLLAVQVVSRVRQSFAVEVPVADLFAAPTIAQLAAGIAGGKWSDAATAAIPRSPRNRALPLSFSQERLWFLDQLQPGSFTDNVPAAVLLKGELDINALERSVNEIVRRHEILRTVFIEADAEPAQKILPELNVKLARIDLSAEAELLCLRPNELEQRIAAEARKPFDLARGPLIRCTLLELNEHEHVFIVVMHHIISDGWSLGVFFDELSKFLVKTDGEVEPLAIQYADYAAWQRETLTGDAVIKHQDYWKKTLAGAPPQLGLPSDHRIAQDASRGAHETIVLPKELTEALRNLNRREGATPFMTLLAGLFVALNRWTKESDIVIGTVHAGRVRRETEKLIGCFMNILPIRAKISDGESALDVLRQTKTAMLEAHAHLECPFEKIVEAIKPDRHASQTPIYNVGFLFQNFPRTVLAAPNLTGEFLPVQTDTALLDLRFVADESDDGISITCEFRAELFEPKTIQQLLSGYAHILEILAKQSETKIAAIELSETASARDGKDWQIRLSESRSLSGASERIRQVSGETLRSDDAKDTIAIVATFTAEPLEEPLRFWMNELECPAEISFAPYNQVFQQLLDPASLLSKNTRGLNVVLARMEDWTRELATNGHTSDDAFTAKIEEGAHELILSLLAAAGRSTSQFLVCICPSAKATKLNPKQAELFAEMERMIAGGLSDAPNVHLVSSEELTASYPVADIYDPQGDELGHVPYTPAFFTALATMIARKYFSHRHPAPKVIVLDCDQTLWSGICGEDGPEKIEIDAPRRALQEFMRAQLDAGRLLCLCSKNNEDDVHAVFEMRTEMPLRREHFVASRINWQPKSENLRDLARELNLGLDSFVLVDDNPVECADIEANCSGAVALQLPDQPELIPQFLKHCWIFDARKVTAEDRQRTAMYQQNQQREQLRAGSRSLSDFLTSLELNVNIASLSPGQLSRAAQLTQRTNQFNLTTRRRTEAEIKELLQRKDVAAFTVSVTDRFGDYGIVGLVIGKFEDVTINVDTFLLSCRVLGRGVEHRILAHLGRTAKDRGLQYVDVHFIPSAKNKPGLDFLQSVGAQFRQSLDGGYVYRFPTEAASQVTLTADNSETTSLALVSAPTSSTNSNGRKFSRWRWIALEANDIEKIHGMVERKIGVRAKKSSAEATPRTETERQLCQIWSRLLRVENVGPRDNFFELGGHSLLAVRLFAQIHKTLGIKLPVVTVFQAPTIEQLARTIEQASLTQSHDSVLLPIQPNGDRPPLFLVHGAGGDVLWGYANLAKHTDPTRPIYGIQACGREEFDTLEDMAAYYVEKVREFQPDGPYHLGGYCFGGNVAYEMARQLEAQGQRVALLALLDAAPSNASYERLKWWRPRFAFDFTRNFLFTFDDFMRLKGHERRSLLLRKLRSCGRKLWKHLRGAQNPDVDLEEVIDPTHVSDRELRLWKLHLNLLVKHVSKPYGGHVTLFRTRAHPLLCSFEDDFAWGELSPRVTVKKVPGSHEGVFMEPHVRELASKLNESFRVCHQQTTNNQPILNFV